MKKPSVCRVMVALALFCGRIEGTAGAQTPDQPNASVAASQPRTSLQWTEMKGKRTQIFIDLHAKGQSTYKGLADGFVPTLMIQLPGDGSVDLLEYQGSGDDWTWRSAHSHIVLTHPYPGVDHIEFDSSVLDPGKTFSVLFRSLNDEWQPVTSSKVLPWHPN
jgi:hypothetical protein